MAFFFLLFIDTSNAQMVKKTLQIMAVIFRSKSLLGLGPVRTGDLTNDRFCQWGPGAFAG